MPLINAFGAIGLESTQDANLYMLDAINNKLPMPDTANRMPVNVVTGALTSVGTVTTVSTVTTVTTVTKCTTVGTVQNLQNFSGGNAAPMAYTMSIPTYLYDRIVVS